MDYTFRPVHVNDHFQKGRRILVPKPLFGESPEYIIGEDYFLKKIGKAISNAGKKVGDAVVKTVAKKAASKTNMTAEQQKTAVKNIVTASAPVTQRFGNQLKTGVALTAVGLGAMAAAPAIGAALGAKGALAGGAAAAGGAKKALDLSGAAAKASKAASVASQANQLIKTTPLTNVIQSEQVKNAASTIQSAAKGTTLGNLIDKGAATVSNIKQKAGVVSGLIPQNVKSAAKDILNQQLSGSKAGNVIDQIRMSAATLPKTRDQKNNELAAMQSIYGNSGGTQVQSSWLQMNMNTVLIAVAGIVVLALVLKR
jgi:hypothetical protein